MGSTVNIRTLNTGVARQIDGPSPYNVANPRRRISADTVWDRQSVRDDDTPHRRLAAEIVITAGKDLRRPLYMKSAAHFLRDTLWKTGLAGIFSTVTQEQMIGLVNGVMGRRKPSHDK